MLWAAQAAKVGFSWNIGNGKRVRFWEDHWFGNATLATQYWDLYNLANEHNATIDKIWDGYTLKLTFRRCFTEEQMSLWFELMEIANSIHFIDDHDSLVWNMNSKGVYTVKSFYKFINFRGVLHTTSPDDWNLKIPPRIQIFLSLLVNNKLLTRDNLSKRQEVGDPTCVFCSENEYVQHLLFDCVIAKRVWDFVSEAFDYPYINSFNDVCALW